MEQFSQIAPKKHCHTGLWVRLAAGPGQAPAGAQGGYGSRPSSV